MKPIKNYRGFVTSLYRSNLFGTIKVCDGIVVARRCRDYFVTRDLLLQNYVRSHRVAYLTTSQADENICIYVVFYPVVKKED